MYELIFLGIIPGTDIQVTFSVWLCAAGLLVAGIATYHRRHARTRTIKWPPMHHKFYAVGRRQVARG